jgi:prolipoprotein diacylglyceryl transferase
VTDRLTSTVQTFLAGFPSPPRGVWYVGPVALRAYAIFIIIGIIVAVWWGNRRFTARGGRPGRITDLAVFMVPFGLVGGRLYHVITDHERYFGPGRNPWKAFAIWEGGLGIWGAVALGALGAWIGCRYYKIPFTAVADSLAPGLVVAQAIGRLGNYFNQELFGSPTTVPWGLEVFLRTPDGVAGTQAMCTAAGSAPEFPTDYIQATPTVLCGTYQPTFLYELLWNLAVAGLLVLADRRFRLGGGRVFALYVAGYTAGRAWIEALRIDPALTRVFGLRVNVVVAIVMFLLAVIYLVVRRKATREDPLLVRGPARTEAEREADLADGIAAGSDEPEAGEADPQDGDEPDVEAADGAEAVAAEDEPVEKPGSEEEPSSVGSGTADESDERNN